MKQWRDTKGDVSLAKMKPCPVCGQTVGLDRLESHIKKVHPRENVKVEFSEEESAQVKKVRSRYRPKIRIKGKHLAPIALIIMMIFIFALIFNPTGLKVGDPPPDFTLSDIYYNQWNLGTHLNDHDERLIFLEFVSPGCTVCANMAPAMHQLFENYSSALEIVTIAVTLNPSSPPTIPDVIKKVDEWDIEWTCLVETQGTDVRDRYRPQWQSQFGTPTYCLIGGDGKVCWIRVGALSFDELERSVKNFI